MKKHAPIASRDLIFVSAEGYETEIHVALSAPYETVHESEHCAACVVWTTDDLEMGTEVFGADKLEALDTVVEFLRLFLRKLATSSGGKLRHLDGSPFDPKGSPFVQQFQQRTSQE